MERSSQPRIQLPLPIASGGIVILGGNESTGRVQDSRVVPYIWPRRKSGEGSLQASVGIVFGKEPFGERGFLGSENYQERGRSQESGEKKGWDFLGIQGNFVKEGSGKN